MSTTTHKLTFRRIHNRTYSLCGLYRTRQLRPGLFVSERTWFPHEKPAHLYAKAWCFVGFADTEEQAQTLCKRCEKQLQQRKPVFTRSTHTQKGPKAQHDLLNTYRGK